MKVRDLRNLLAEYRGDLEIDLRSTTGFRSWHDDRGEQHHEHFPVLYLGFTWRDEDGETDDVDVIWKAGDDEVMAGERERYRCDVQGDGICASP